MTHREGAQQETGQFKDLDKISNRQNLPSGEQLSGSKVQFNPDWAEDRSNSHNPWRERSVEPTGLVSLGQPAVRQQEEGYNPGSPLATPTRGFFLPRLSTPLVYSGNQKAVGLRCRPCSSEQETGNVEEGGAKEEHKHRPVAAWPQLGLQTWVDGWLPHPALSLWSDSEIECLSGAPQSRHTG